MKKQDFSLSPWVLIAGAAFLFFRRRPQGDKDSKKIPRKAFDASSGKPIDPTKAGKLTKRYHKDYPENTRANYCSRDVIEDIFGNEHCVGLRIYRARTEEGVHGIVVVGVDEAGKDITSDRNPFAAELVFTADSYEKCPYNCDRSSVLY